MNTRDLIVGLLTSALGVGLAGCGTTPWAGAARDPFTLPIGSTTWDAHAPAWWHDNTLHVGDRTVAIGSKDRPLEEFVLSQSGVYWISNGSLFFTDPDGTTQEVDADSWGNIAISADRSVFATMDQSRGPTDRYGTHVMQAAVFDTLTGEQLYRTPDAAPDPDDDLADLYSEIMPLLYGVSRDRLFVDRTTINLADGSSHPATMTPDRVDVYQGFADTLFTDGYHVSIRGEGRRRTIDRAPTMGSGRLSPDRSLLFDVSNWPSDAVAYDAQTGQQRPIDAPWDHFTLVAWSDADSFFGLAEEIDQDHPTDIRRARQVVTCELATLACTPVSPVIRTADEPSEDGEGIVVVE